MRPQFLLSSWLTNTKATIRYKGTCFSGSQVQPTQRTVEGELKKGLKELYKIDVPLVLSGRTDSGVHAEGQVINYNAPLEIPNGNVLNALNSILPDDIQVVNIETVDDEFNARFSAVSREYRYLFTQKEVPLWLNDFVVRYPEFNIDMNEFTELCEIIVGENTFTHFKALGSNERHDRREIKKCCVAKTDMQSVFYDTPLPVYQFVVEANSFLYRMVRNLIGAMIEVLRGKQSIADFKAMLTSKNKIYLYTTAPAKGLCLMKVNY